MRAFFIVCISLLLPCAGGLSAESIILRNGFETVAQQGGFSKIPGASWVKRKGGSYLRVSVDNRRTHGMVQAVVDLTPYRGKEVILKCRIKAQDVSKPKAAYNGIKLMLHYETPLAGKQWPGLNNLWGTFDWKTVNRRVTLPKDIGEAVVVLGLQDSRGTVFFDDLEIKLSRHQLVEHPPPMKNPPPVGSSSWRESGKTRGRSPRSCDWGSRMALRLPPKTPLACTTL